MKQHPLLHRSQRIAALRRVVSHSFRKRAKPGLAWRPLTGRSAQSAYRQATPGVAQTLPRRMNSGNPLTKLQKPESNREQAPVISWNKVA
jgi:hypothetical protein